MKRLLGLCLFVAACGGGGAPEAKIVVAPQPSSKPAPLTEPAQKQGTPIEYIAIPLAWVEKYVPTPAADVKAWTEDPKNKGAIKTTLRHVFTRTQKKCESALARIQKGEDFAKVAKDASEDPDAQSGGVLGTSASSYFEPLRNALDALAPGETGKTCVNVGTGFHVVRKDAPSEDETLAAYRKAKAPDVTNKLAVDVLARLRTTDSARAAIAAAVEGALGDQAEADPARPAPTLVDHDRLDALHLPPEVKSALEAFMTKAHAGEALDAPLALKHGLAVARAWGPPAR